MDQLRTEFITRSKITEDLRALGVETGDLLMLHASVKAIGWIVGGPEIVLQSILDVIGSSGTLTMMVGWEDYPYHLPEWPEEKRLAYLAECPPFDPANSRANHREFGILCEYLRTLPGALRSRHPSCSFAAVGSIAKHLVQDHPMQFGFGVDSPLDKLVKGKGKVLNLGAPLDTLTILHFSEHIAELAEKRIARYKMPVLVEGRKAWCEFQEFDSSLGIVDWEGEDYFTLVARDYISQGHVLEGRVGNATSFLFDAATLANHGKQWMEREFVKVRRPSSQS